MTSSSTSISGVATTSRRRVFLVVFLALVALVVIRYRPQGFLPFLSWCCAVGAFLCTCMSAFLSADRDETYRRAPSEPGSSFLGVVGLLLGVTASVGVAVLLVLRGISVSLTWVHGVPGGDIPALGFEAQGLWTVFVLFWTCAIGFLSTRDGRLGTGLFWCTLCVGLWTCLLIPPFRVTSTGAMEYTGNSLLLLVCLTFLQCLGAAVSSGKLGLAWDRNVQPLAKNPIATGWPGLEKSSLLLGFGVVIVVSYHLAVPSALRLGSQGTWALVVAACSAASATASLCHGLRFRRAMAVDLGLFLVVLTACALVASCVSIPPGALGKRYPWLFNAMMVGSAIVGLGAKQLASAWRKQDESTTGSLRKWLLPRLRQAAFLSLMLALLLGWLAAIWPRLPGIATTDDTLQRVTWGLASYLVVCLASLQVAHGFGGRSTWMLCILSYVCTATFVGMRLVPFAPE
ncbi:MAG: hypothetical protein AABZ47_00805 [Planctomycetota bacterium]